MKSKVHTGSVLGIMGTALATALLGGCMHTNTSAQPISPIQRIASVLVGSEKCGGTLSGEMNTLLAATIKEHGTGALQAEEYSYRAYWAQAGLDTDAVQRDAMCARIFRNGWLR